MEERMVLSIGEHHGKRRLFARFPKRQDLIDRIKSIPGATFSWTHRAWHFFPSRQVVDAIIEKCGGVAVVDAHLLEQQWEQQEHVQDMQKLAAPAGRPEPAKVHPEAADLRAGALEQLVNHVRLRNLSPNTLRTYKFMFIRFLQQFPGRDPRTIKKDEIIAMMIRLLNRDKLSGTVQNQMINAIKFYYEKVLLRPRETYDLPRAKKAFKTPPIFAGTEVSRILLALDNVKHRAILCLGYSAGLRVSEIVSLRLADIDRERNVLNVRGAKGKKDREVILSPALLMMLEIYYRACHKKPKEWVFEGQYGGQYSSRSVAQVMRKAKVLAGIDKKGSIHALRHSFATALYEKGHDLLAIKQLLGHNSLRTTSIYTHVSRRHISKIRSPLDDLNLDLGGDAGV